MVYVWHHVTTLTGCLMLIGVTFRRPWTRARPAAAVLLWHLLLAGTVLSVIGVLVGLALRAARRGVIPGLWQLFTTGRGVRDHADLVLIAAACGLTAAILVFHLIAGRRRHRIRQRHRDLVDLLGDHRDLLTVIENSAVAVYALPGRSPRIVATSGALERLSPAELDAVLAHERGHLVNRHDLLLFPFYLLRKAVPHPAVAAVEAEVSLLLELCADRSALARVDDVALRTALLALSPGTDTSVVATRLQSLAGTTRARLLTTSLALISGATLCANTLSLYLLPV